MMSITDYLVGVMALVIGIATTVQENGPVLGSVMVVFALISPMLFLWILDRRGVKW